MELLITWQGSGIKGLTPAEPSAKESPTVHYPHGSGDSDCVGHHGGSDCACAGKNVAVELLLPGNTFKATDTWFGFDGWKGNGKKTAVVFYRNGHGQITNMALKQDGMGKLDI